MHKHYDIVIAGGGLVGGSFALLLNTLAEGSGLRVLLLDAAMPSVNTTSSEDFDARSTAVSAGSQLIYEQAGLWPALAQQATAIRDIHVSDRGHFGATRLRSSELDVDALGYVLENHHFGKVLHQALDNRIDLDYVTPASVSHIQPVPAGVHLKVSAHSEGEDTEQQIEASLLVLADGGRSGLCQQLGITMQQHKYGQKALICNIAFEKAHEGRAFERFTDTGPLAVLPLSDHGSGRTRQHRGALIWTLTDASSEAVTADELCADAVMALPDERFIASLQQRFGWRLGRITHAGARSLYPLSLVTAREQIRPGIVLLGNVAHTLHPVAGQGLNLALRDARSLAELIVAAKHAGSPLGEMATLTRFLQAQAADQQQTISFSDLTTRLFSNKQPALALGRNAGLLLMDVLPPARNWFARQAMGMADRRSIRF